MHKLILCFNGTESKEEIHKKLKRPWDFRIITGGIWMHCMTV